MPPPPRQPRQPSRSTSFSKGGPADMVAQEKAKKVRRIMAEVALMLESYKANSPKGELTSTDIFRMALFQAKTEILKAKKDRLTSFREIREHMHICEAADEFLKSNGFDGSIRTKVNHKWAELVTWSRKAEEMIQSGLDKVSTVPGYYVGNEMPPRAEIQRLADEVPAYRQHMIEENKNLYSQVPEGILVDGEIDENFESYLRFTERSSSVAVPRVRELLHSISPDNAANPVLATVDRYDSYLKGLLQKHDSHKIYLEKADLLHREGNYLEASATVASIGVPFPDLNYQVVGEIKSIETDLMRMERMEGQLLATTAEAILAKYPGLSAESALALRLAKAREDGLSKKSRSRLIVGVLSVSTVLGIGLAAYAGIGFVTKSKLDEEKRLARQEAEKKRARTAEAEAEARRALMREESRKAELENITQTAGTFTPRPADKETEAFLTLHKGAPYNVATGAKTKEMTLNWIPAGTFQMGGGIEGDNDARITTVTINNGFWLGCTEVTQAQWTALMDNNPSDHIGKDLPVEQVHWTEASNFCRLLTTREQRAGRLPKGLAYSLPSEAQWEYASRANQEGNAPANLTAFAWCMDNGGAQTNPVGTLKANPWGLFDMFGNVSEWCSDWYAPYSGGIISDPIGPQQGRRRVNRGGSWLGTINDYRFQKREKDIPEIRSKSIGFRVALVRQ